MPYKISYDKNKFIVKLEIFGTNSKEDYLLACNKTLNLCKKYECSNLLVDMKKLDSIPGDLLDCLKFGKKIAKEYVGIKIAHVLPKNSKLKDLVEFTSTVEYNRGGFVQDFDTVKDAINWFHIKENLTKI